MSDNSGWLAIASLFLGSFITLASQVFIQNLNEVSSRKREHWKERVERLRQLRLKISQLVHNVNFEAIYVPRLADKAKEFFEDFVYDLGEFSDFTAQFYGLGPKINEVAKLAGSLRTADDVNYPLIKEQLHDAYLDVLNHIEEAIKELDAEATYNFSATFLPRLKVITVNYLRRLKKFIRA